MADAGQGDKLGIDQLLTVIPDANVLIHARALTELPWVELGRPAVEVLFVPPVIRELDKLKTQTGRPNRIARQLSSDVRQLIRAPGRRGEVRKASPAVSKRVEFQSVDDAAHPALKLDHADQALINYGLHLRREGIDVLLLTDDTICGTTAQEVGLPVMFLPDAWLREAEPDETARENVRLKAELHRLSAAEPRIELAFRDSAGRQVTRLDATLTRWPALEAHEVDALMAEVERRCPCATSFEPQPRSIVHSGLDPSGAIARLSRMSVMATRSVYEPASEREIEQYVTRDYPRWLETVRKALEALHVAFEVRTQWPAVVAAASNAGTRPATGTLVAIHVRGRFSISNDEATSDGEEDHPTVRAPIELPPPPTPPRGRTRMIDPFGHHRVFDALGSVSARHLPIDLPRLSPPRPRDDDAFYWRAGRRDWVDVMELECANWRHGQDAETFPFKIRPDEQADTSGAIEFILHAHNVSDPVFLRLPVRIAFQDGSTIEQAHALIKSLGHDGQPKRPL